MQKICVEPTAKANFSKLVQSVMHIRRELDCLLKLGIIEPAHFVDWAYEYKMEV